jgi:hypothetical protein
MSLNVDKERQVLGLSYVAARNTLWLSCVLIRPQHAFLGRGRFCAVLDDSCADGEIEHFLPTLLIHVAPRWDRVGYQRVSQVEKIIIQPFGVGKTVRAQCGLRLLRRSMK